jgi:hypothetical protein
MKAADRFFWSPPDWITAVQPLIANSVEKAWFLFTHHVQFWVCWAGAAFAGNMSATAKHARLENLIFPSIVNLRDYLGFRERDKTSDRWRLSIDQRSHADV